MRISVNEPLFIVPSNLCKDALKDGLYLSIDSNESNVNILLPKIGVYPNLKVVIIDNAGIGSADKLVKVTGYIDDVYGESPTQLDFIDGEESVGIQNDFDSLTLEQVSDKNWSCIQPLNEQLNPVKHILLSFTQNGSATPVMSVSRNDVSNFIPTISRSIAGSFVIDLNDLNALAGKTPIPNISHSGESDPLQTIKYIDNGQFTVKNVRLSDGTLGDFLTTNETNVQILIP